MARTNSHVVIATTFAIAWLADVGRAQRLFHGEQFPFVGILDLAADDFDGDGRADVVASSYRIAFGTAQGGFTVTTNHVGPSGYSPRCVVTHDLNGDGNADFVVGADGPAPMYPGGLFVFLGNGQGGFAPYSGFGCGEAPQQVRVGDLNGDAIPDLVSASYYDSSISVLLGAGGGSFQTTTDIVLPTAQFLAEIADVNADGKLDLVSAGSSVYILLGNGLGAFAPPLAISLGPGVEATSLALGDVDADGDLDIVTANQTGNSISVLVGNGSGGFVLGSTHPTTYGRPNEVELHDLTGDGRLDAVTTNDFLGSISVFPGLAGGGFGPVIRSFGPGAYHSLFLDVDNDGNLDALTARPSFSVLSVLHGTGQGSFQTSQDQAFSGGVSALVAGDLDGDGHQDVVTATNGGVAYALGTGTGALAPPTVLIAGPTPWEVALGDLTADGRPDVVCSTGNAGTIIAFKWVAGVGLVGTGAFAMGSGNFGVAIGDLNGDGFGDVVSGNPGTISSSNASIGVRLGDGLGGFGPLTTLSVPFGTWGIALGDLNHDGHLDIVSGQNRAQGITRFLGNGMGGFGPSASFPIVDYASLVVLRDMNADGNLDVVTSSYQSGSGMVTMLLGDGQGGLTSAGSYPMPGAPFDLEVEDVNGDGFVDVACAAGGSGSLGLLLADGSGGFIAHTPYPCFPGPFGLALVDMDEDGVLDAVTCGSESGQGALRVHLNRQPRPPVPVAYCVGDGTGAACPCGNFGSIGGGCANSWNPAGVRLTAEGGARVSADSWHLRAGGIATSPALFIQALNPSGGGIGLPFGDGLLCVGHTIVRLGIVHGVGDIAAYPGAPPNQVPISSQGAIVAGHTRNYQVWYRDAALGYCTASTFNLTNGLRVTWAP